MIDFSCLNCGILISCADDDAGDQMECPGCAIVLRVPTPIGGRLTDKRLPSATTRAVADTVAARDAGDDAGALLPAVLEAGAKPQRPAIPPEAPRFGFTIEYALIGVFGRDQQAQLQASLENICDGLNDHLEGRPQFFTSGGLLIEVHRFEVEIGSIDLRLHMRGNLNGEPVSETILTHDSPGGSTRSILLSGFVGVALANVGNRLLRTFVRRWGLTRAYRRAARLATRDLARSLNRVV
jgi:hypothetical protein